MVIVPRFPFWEFSMGAARGGTASSTSVSLLPGFAALPRTPIGKLALFGGISKRKMR